MNTQALLIALMLICFSSSTFGVVKQSRSGICHPPDSPWYAKTSNKVTFKSVEACIEAGGRLPKGYVPSKSAADMVEDATNDAIIEGRDFVTLYDRNDYKHWSDFDGDCQNTRQEILISTSQVEVTFTNAKACTVKTGKWYDPYTDKTWTKASDVDIDHIVPLAAAHSRGAYAWSPSLKEQFANDPLNLIPVEDNTNQEKGAKGPADWMPPNHSYRCDYLKRYQLIMNKYGLSYHSSERRVVGRMMKACNIAIDF
ncbi:HNH endonuclease family protein [Alteromonas facilis]|uniref:HNH endonuclease family protein n=1 Tax=Alteromonas facilis TaxID=2048004 RepID=UPI000C288DC6|nr:HNH endonuclease family protein [Alteromonas facilis]